MFLAGALLGTAGLGGCATVTRGTMDDVAFLSTPDGASVVLSTGQSCKTPCTLRLPRKTPFTATLKKGGFREASVDVKVRVSKEGLTAGAGNILLGGAIGAAADVASGATLGHTPNPVAVALEPNAGAPADGSHGTKIMSEPQPTS